MQEKSLYSANVTGLESALATNKVLKNTYMLLSMTLLFSAATAGVSMAIGLGQGAGLILLLVGVWPEDEQQLSCQPEGHRFIR